jgi:hypothetical protein
MSRVRHRLTRRAASLLLLALLMVPVALRGHAHANHAVQSACAACLVAHHTPTTSAAPVATVQPVFATCRATSAGPIARSVDEQPVAHGRAPPRLLSARPA